MFLNVKHLKGGIHSFPTMYLGVHTVKMVQYIDFLEKMAEKRSFWRQLLLKKTSAPFTFLSQGQGSTILHRHMIVTLEQARSLLRQSAKELLATLERL